MKFGSASLLAHSNMDESQKYYSEQTKQGQRNMFSDPMSLTLKKT